MSFSNDHPTDTALILLVKTRMDFLLLTMSPDKVRDQLVREFDGLKDEFGYKSKAALIVEQPR
jgi:hypothetical protein